MEETMDILLIESRAKSACMIQALLDECSNMFRKQWTYSLTKAIEMLGENTFDCILTNIILSEGGGTEIIENLATRAPTTPIIALVDQGSWEIGRKMIAAGAQDFLNKDELSPALLRKSIIYSIDRQRLMEDIRALTTRDELTGLYNRRGFKQLSEQQLRIACRSSSPVTLLFIDLDNLKQINDLHGHPVGDLAICETADVLRQVLRASDIVGRLGGDEFVITAPDTKNGNVDFLVQRLRDTLQERNTGETKYHLSASIGFVTYEGGEYDLDKIIKEACELMYKEKNAKKATVQ